jgi:hypothetical protein
MTGQATAEWLLLSREGAVPQVTAALEETH